MTSEALFYVEELAAYGSGDHFAGAEWQEVTVSDCGGQTAKMFPTVENAIDFAGALAKPTDHGFSGVRVCNQDHRPVWDNIDGHRGGEEDNGE